MIVNRIVMSPEVQRTPAAMPPSPTQPIAARFHVLTQSIIVGRSLSRVMRCGEDTAPAAVPRLAGRRASRDTFGMRKPHLSVFLVPALTAAGLCEAPMATLPEADASHIEKHLPGVVLGPSEKVPPLSDVTDWYPLQDATFRYDRPVDAGKKATLVLSSGVRAPGTPVGSPREGWRMTVSDGATRYLSERDKTGIVIPSEVSTANGLIIRLNPPEPVVLAGLKPGHVDSRDIKVKIYDVHDPAVVTHSGTVRCTWSDLGGWRVKTPKGEFDARLVRVTYSGSVGPASVSAQKYVFLAPGIGAVAFTDAREISAFLFFSDDSDHAGVLRSIEKTEPKATPGTAK